MEAIVLLGAPGAGKGTAARGLEGRTDYRHLSTGDLFRVKMYEDTPVGRAIRPYMEQGQLVPDELVMDVVGELLREVGPDDRILFDGFPRTVGQAKAFDGLLKASGSALVSVFLLDVDPEVLIGRLKGRMICPGCGTIYHAKTKPPAREGECDHCTGQLLRREDDEEETVRKRLGIYEERTRPLIDYFEEAGVLKRINGAGTPEAVLGQIVEELGRAGTKL